MLASLTKRRFARHARRVLNRVGLRRQRKVFAVGFNKSGTTSLHALFESLGLMSHHGVRWRSCDDLALLRSYDCFSDGIPRDLSKLDRLFPGSKFILQVRDLDTWVYSCLAHIERRKREGRYKNDPLWDLTDDSITHWVRLRNEHHHLVLSYFAERPDDLLVVNFVRDPEAATKICSFLGYDKTVERPAENVNPNKQPPLAYREMLLRCVARLGIPEDEVHYDIFCPSLLSSADAATFPVDTRLLVKMPLAQRPNNSQT